MNVPKKITLRLVAPDVALVRPAPRMNPRTRKHAAARWLKAMRLRARKAGRYISADAVMRKLSRRLAAARSK